MVQEWADAIRENGKQVVVMIVALGALVGYSVTEEEGLAAVDGLAQLALAGGAAFVSLNVMVSKIKAAFKADPDIDTGPTTPGPVLGGGPEE